MHKQSFLNLLRQNLLRDKGLLRYFLAVEGWVWGRGQRVKASTKHSLVFCAQTKLFKSPEKKWPPRDKGLLRHFMAVEGWVWGRGQRGEASTKHSLVFCL